jgi:DNA-directed RNA polymerase specialized sigma24 family protein
MEGSKGTTMTIAAMCAETRQGKRATDHAISRAFLTAHLLTANREQAESAVLEAILHWDLEEGTEEVFLHRVACAAIQAQVEYESSNAGEPAPAELLLPVELQAVLDLSPQLRRCFVLRVLVGLSRQVCARLLDLSVLIVDQYTCAALEHLAGVGCPSLIPVPRGETLDTQLELLGIQRFRVEEKHSVA